MKRNTLKQINTFEIIEEIKDSLDLQEKARAFNDGDDFFNPFYLVEYLLNKLNEDNELGDYRVGKPFVLDCSSLYQWYILRISINDEVLYFELIEYVIYPEDELTEEIVSFDIISDNVKDIVDALYKVLDNCKKI